MVSIINKRFLAKEFDEFIYLHIKRINELYKGEIILDNILNSKMEIKQKFVVFDKRWIDDWKSIVGYEIFREKYKNFTSINKNEINEVRDFFIKFNVKQKLEELGTMDTSNFLIKYPDKYKFINEKSDFILVLAQQCTLFLQTIKVCITINSQILNGKIFIDNSQKIKKGK